VIDAFAASREFEQLLLLLLPTADQGFSGTSHAAEFNALTNEQQET